MSVGIGRLNPAFGSSRSASSAYQKWPTGRSHSMPGSKPASRASYPFKVGRPICTSGPLRASTRVSSGFALPGHSSPSFGYHRARSCSTSPAVRRRRAGGAPRGGFACPRVFGFPPPGDPAPADPTSAGAVAGLHFHCAVGFRVGRVGAL
ncbi:translation initiation factor IF-2-like [Tachysurus ichikawai]